MGVEATLIGQGTSGIDDDVIDGGDISAGTLSADVWLEAALDENGTFFVDFETGRGDGIDYNEDDNRGAQSFGGFNADATGDASLDILELWYEHALHDGATRVQVGHIDLTGNFDTNAVANDETAQFLEAAW